LAVRFALYGGFYRHAFARFSSGDLSRFFSGAGLSLKTERQGRIFPVTDKASSVNEVLEKEMRAAGVNVYFNARVISVTKSKESFKLTVEGIDRDIYARNVIVATGGCSYTGTGSTGDGFLFARSFGHDIEDLFPALVPLTVKEEWVKTLQGLTLKNVRIAFDCIKKKIVSGIGECMFTHFGISGPLVLDLSGEILPYVIKNGSVNAYIDVKPGLSQEQLEGKFLKEFVTKGNMDLKNYLDTILPRRLAVIFPEIAGILPGKKLNQITRPERKALAVFLKKLSFTIDGSLPLNRAMVTAGGVSIKQIDAKSMESKKVFGLYFAGEVIAGHAPSGGYNLQQAFSTGYLAGENAALSRAEGEGND